MSRKLSILQLINVRWYNACAHYAISLSDALRKKGHEVIVAGDPQSPPLVKAEELGLPVYEDLFLSHTSPWMILYNVKRMVDLVEEKGIDVINAHRGEGHLVAALSKNFSKRRVPLVRTRGDVRPPRPNIFNRFLNSKLTDKIITTCGTLRASYIKDLSIPDEKVINVPVGTDHDFFSPESNRTKWREKLTIPDRNLVVGMVGRLSPVKGHKYFIQSAKYVLKRVPRTTFIVCGEDAQLTADQLKERTRTLGIQESFRLVGRIKDIRDIISLFDVGVVASVGSETICRVALEYMSMGKPVVGTYVNSIPEVVEDGINGLVVDPGSAQELADALIELLQNHRKRKKFGEKSRSIVLQKFTLDKFAQRTQEVYFSLLN